MPHGMICRWGFLKSHDFVSVLCKSRNLGALDRSSRETESVSECAISVESFRGQTCCPMLYYGAVNLGSVSNFGEMFGVEDRVGTEKRSFFLLHMYSLKSLNQHILCLFSSGFSLPENRIWFRIYYFLFSVVVCWQVMDEK